jgi:hypothetical protein
LWCPLHVVVQYLPLILLGPNGKLCTLSLWRRASLILLNVYAGKMLDILCLRCNHLYSCFVLVMVRAFMCVYFVLLLVVFITRICVCCHRAGSLPAFEHFSTHSLLVHTPPSCGLSFFIYASPPRRLLFRVRELVSRSRTRYSNSYHPLDYACVRWGYLLWTRHWCCSCCLFIESVGHCESHLFYLLSLV